jgi:hypothetical protein
VLKPFSQVKKMDLDWDSIFDNTYWEEDSGRKVFQDALAERGGFLLCPYVSIHTEVKVGCHLGHIWKTTAQNVFEGSWCPHCFRRYRESLKFQQSVEKRGALLLTPYISFWDKVTLLCSGNHEWRETPQNILKGQCPNCQEERNFRRFVEEKGGHLTTPYINKASLVGVLCFEGHRWQRRARDILKGAWCPECSSPSLFELLKFSVQYYGVLE